MKRMLCLLLLLALLFEKNYSQVGFGIKGGLNFARAKEAGTNNNSYRFGFNAGIFVPVSISEKFSFQSELLYSVKGFKASPNFYHNGSTISLNYIALPLLAVFHAGDKFAVLAGPEPGLLANAKAKVSNVTYDISDTYKSFDIAFDIGLRYLFKRRFGAELRYSYGLIDIANKEQYDNTGQQVANYHLHGNRVFQCNLVYMLTRKK